MPATPNHGQGTRHDFALEVKPIDDTYKLNGISWAQVNWFEPFYDSQDRSTKFYQQAPTVEV